jgi:hypothetical protein
LRQESRSATRCTTLTSTQVLAAPRSRFRHAAPA